MLKLTQIEYQEGSPIWIAVAHITALQPSPSGGTTVWTGSSNKWVKETAEEIMAMEPMVYHLHPAMIVNPNGSFVR